MEEVTLDLLLKGSKGIWKNIKRKKSFSSDGPFQLLAPSQPIWTNRSPLGISPFLCITVSRARLLKYDWFRLVRLIVNCTAINSFCTTINCFCTLKCKTRTTHSALCYSFKKSRQCKFSGLCFCKCKKEDFPKLKRHWRQFEKWSFWREGLFYTNQNSLIFQTRQSLGWRLPKNRMPYRSINVKSLVTKEKIS